MSSRLARCIVLAGLCLATGLVSVGCDDDTFGEAELKEVRKVVHTGVDLDSDPYVQAETLRVLALMADPSFDSFARKLVDADSAMVRIAALRVLLKNRAHDIRRVTLAAFNAAGLAEQRQILVAVHTYGATSLRRVLTSRALRSRDAKLRRRAFAIGPLARLKKAVSDGDTSYLETTLYPELGQFVRDDDVVVAGEALKALVELGQQARAESRLETLADASAGRDQRLAAAKVLTRARVPAAVDAFKDILEAVDISEQGEFVFPEKIDRQLVRAATLGLVAMGDPTYVEQVQGYLENADAQASIEVLEALATNPSADAAISLKIAMQDARQSVRYRAIELYASHKRAKATDFVSALGASDYESKKRLADVLAGQYPGAWADYLEAQLARKDSRQDTLDLLRDVILTDQDAQAIKPLTSTLRTLVAADDSRVAAQAALLLVKVADAPKARALLAKVDDPQTRYAYLEYLVRTAPKEHRGFFRDNFYSDLYAIRLMSAAGLMIAHNTDTSGAGKPDESS